MPTLRLPVPLTESERVTVGSEMSAAWTAYEEVEAEKKEATKGFNTTLKEHRSTIHRLSVSLETGTIEREIEVKDVEILEDGIVQTIRLDTNEVVKSRAMDPEERQLKIAGSDVSDAVRDKLAQLGRTEEQRAENPDEAEALRETRLAEEAAMRAFEALSAGDNVELKLGEEWEVVKVENKTEFHFETMGKLYDISKHGVSWRLPPTWDEVKAASEENARKAEIERLAAEQAADKPKTLLRNPRKKKDPPTVSVQDGDGKSIALPQATEMCAPDCGAKHVHTENRTAF